MTDPMPQSIHDHITDLLSDPKRAFDDLTRGLTRMFEGVSAWDLCYNERSSPITWRAAEFDDEQLRTAMQSAGWKKTSVSALRALIKEASKLSEGILGKYKAYDTDEEDAMRDAEIAVASAEKWLAEAKQKLATLNANKESKSK